jgi:hypothetical protein
MNADAVPKADRRQVLGIALRGAALILDTADPVSWYSAGETVAPRQTPAGLEYELLGFLSSRD